MLGWPMRNSMGFGVWERKYRLFKEAKLQPILRTHGVIGVFLGSAHAEKIARRGAYPGYNSLGFYLHI